MNRKLLGVILGIVFLVLAVFAYLMITVNRGATKITSDVIPKKISDSTSESRSIEEMRRIARDSKRKADMVSMRVALALYFEDNKKYPGSVDVVSIGENNALVLTATGFGKAVVGGEKVYFERLPSDPSKSSGNHYLYACTNSSCSSYTLSFNFEGDFDGLSAGKHVATPIGIQ